MQENEVFVIDLSSAITSGEIINNISLALEIPSASGKKIYLKLKDTVLNQSQILSIKSLITSYVSTLARVETQSLITYSVCESMGISVSKPSDTQAENVPIQEETERKEPSHIQVQTPSEFAAKSPEEVLKVSTPEEVLSAVSISQELSQEDVLSPVSEEIKEEIASEDINIEKAIFDTAQMAPPEGEKQVIGVYKKAESENSVEETYEDVDFYAPPTDEPVVIDSKQTIYVNQTLRSGQTLEFDGNIIIIGDCHPGSEVKASGDITVWGVLGSIAHAGVKGNRDAKIRALKMHAVQLRIANCYSRRPDCNNIPYIVKSHTFTPEEARIVDDCIVLYKI